LKVTAITLEGRKRRPRKRTEGRTVNVNSVQKWQTLEGQKTTRAKTIVCINGTEIAAAAEGKRKRGPPQQTETVKKLFS